MSGMTPRFSRPTACYGSHGGKQLRHLGYSSGACPLAARQTGYAWRPSCERKPGIAAPRHFMEVQSTGCRAAGRKVTTFFSQLISPRWLIRHYAVLTLCAVQGS
jgi:hypothetical protein